MELSLWSINTVNGFPHPSIFWHQTLTHSSSAPSRGKSIFVFNADHVFRHLWFRARSPLEKPAWYEDSLIQSMFPADRQLVCNSSMISPWAMDFSRLVTCWVCGLFSICIVWVGAHTPHKGCGWLGSHSVAFNQLAWLNGAISTSRHLNGWRNE